MAWTTNDIAAAAERCRIAMRTHEQELNALDSRLGDGDTGQTMRRLAEVIATTAGNHRASETDIGVFLRRLGMAGATATGSSLGTLIAIGLMEMGKRLTGSTEFSLPELVSALERAEAAMLARGGAVLGDKTALDLLHAVRTSLATASLDPAEAANSAAEEALAAFRDRPCRIGRARIFAERSVGADDAGMLAFARLTSALAETAATAATK
jgi:dihydroxyacetone kinase-like protein